MSHSNLEVADIFRSYGAAWRQSQKGHLSLLQLKAMSAIEHCRSAALSGHVLRCPACEHIQVAYNSCRNRHCPKCQASAAHRWLEARQANLLPVDYYHLVFTLPSQISDIAYYNKSVVYGILFRAAAQTLRMIAADPKHLGARIGVTLVLHTWGSAMTHHPHVHGIVPGGGLSADGEHWIACRPGFFLPVRVLSRLFRRLFLEQLGDAYYAGKLQPVPLRLVGVIAGWSVEGTLNVLSQLERGGAMLTAYQYIPRQKPRKVRHAEFGRLLKNPSIKKQVTIFPLDYFVWSDELAMAFSHDIYVNISPENAVEDGMELIWNPALRGSLRRTINACVDLTALQIKPSRPLTLGQKARKKRNEQFCQKQRELLSQAKPGTKINVANRIYRDRKLNPDKALKEKSIRHILATKCK
jgi:hypothetical protein